MEVEIWKRRTLERAPYQEPHWRGLTAGRSWIPILGHPLAQGIVDTISDPLLVLDQDLRVVTANRAFHQTFKMSRQDIQGRPLYGLGDGQWDYRTRNE